MATNYWIEKELSGLTESRLLKLLNKRYPNIKKIEDQFSSIDCIDSTSNTFYELKCRYQHFSALLIEKEKYLALKEKENSYYVSSTPNGIYMFHIQKIEEPVWRKKLLPHTTEFGKLDWIEKEIGEIHIKDALEITHLIL